eukprot:TRINITY_DN4864_c0_g1_i2.p1 TRINITY_DN4864_c0_g1~~TRINITY_DN4864_c0_g1_i2.p1  ORF type:complete len:453 (+),score=72.15 TRINITY_DN4864_c0_g1_i2:111-1469(+)
MEDIDSDLEVISTVLNRVKKKASVHRFENSIHFDGDSLYETVNQKTKKMNKRKRVVLKNGLTNVTYKNISMKRRRYVSDLYTTLLDSSWTYCVLMFTTSFYGSWVLFGGIYYIISYLHGDFLEENLSDSEWLPCISATDGFAACFLFSLETQHTIGYGTRQTTTECPDAMFVMSVQSVLGCIIQAFMVGLVFSKLSRPQYRCKTIIFSNQAVITVRNKKLCLIIRVGDLRDDNFILGTQISAKLLRRRVSSEGEVYQEMHNLVINPETTSESCIFFVWPLDIVHIIDENSPFYEMSEADFVSEGFEIILVMEGMNETSNMIFQARTSYLPNEILWGHRFEPMQLYRKDNNKFEINFSAFHSTYEVDTPLYSARQMYQLERQREMEIKQMENMLKGVMGNGRDTINNHSGTPSIIGEGSLTPSSDCRPSSQVMRNTSDMFRGDSSASTLQLEQ